MYILSHLILTILLKGRECQPYFTHEDAEAHRDSVTCLKSPNQVSGELDHTEICQKLELREEKHG